MSEEADYTFHAFVFNGGLYIELWEYKGGFVDFKVASRNDPDIFWFECLFRGSKDDLVDQITAYAENLHDEGIVNLRMDPYWKTYLRNSI